jgi:predicted enzyme related to lactoylglutathione lyase
MPTKMLAVTFDCHDPVRQAAFWATTLSYDEGDWYEIADSEAASIEDPSGMSPALLFIRVPESKVVKNRVHLDLAPETSIETEVERLTAAGAHTLRTVKESEEVEEPWIWTVMQDPEGNEFCVGEPQSRRT